MIDRLSRGLAALVVILVAMHAVPAFVPTAAAQPKQKKDAETAKKVLQLIREGNAAFGEESYEQAFQKYEEAYELYPDPAILVRLGKTAEKLGNTREAIEYFNEFARLMPDDPAAKKLTARADELEEKLPTVVTVTTEPSGAEIYLTKAREASLGTTPADIELAPGTHTLYLKRKGFETASEEVEVEAGGEKEVSVTLTRAMIAEDEDETNKSVEPIESESSSIGTYGYASLGVGLVTLATSGTFLYLKGVAEDDVNDYDKRAPGASRRALQERKDDANAYYDTALVTGIAGGVLTATGVGLLGYHYMSADADDEVVWNVGAGFDTDQAWLGVNGSF